MYPASEDLSQKKLRDLRLQALAWMRDVGEPLDARLRARERLPLRADAVAAIHRPQSLPEAEVGRTRLAFDELLVLQLAIARTIATRESASAEPLGAPGELLERYRASLPFTLTPHQERALAEIDADLARSVPIPISADESLTSDHSLLEIARREAARVVQTKSGKNGGIHGVRRLWALAESLGIGIFPGNHPSSGVNVAAVAHLAAAWPGPLLVGDFQTGSVDMIAEDILQTPVRVADGLVHVPQGPGLGVTLDEDKVARFRVDR